MKLKVTHRTTAIIVALMMLLSISASIFSVHVSAATTNYAKGCTYITSSASYLSGKEDNGYLLTNGVVGTDEANGVTVSYAGTQKTYTLVFDLGTIKYDIKTIKFLNVYISGNRDFSPSDVTISVSKESGGSAGYKNTYTYDSVVQHSTNYFNYTYELSTEAIGRYVTITMYSPQYVISLSEIEIWGSGNPAVDDNDTPVAVNYAKGSSYTAPAASYSTGFEDNGTRLTDGVVGLTEQSGTTVAYAGSDKTYTIVFDLGVTRDDIKTIKIRNVNVTGNRGFSPDRVSIAATDSQNSSEPVSSAYTYVKELQSGTTYFDFVYTLNSTASGRYVFVTIHTPSYILSLSEIEIYGIPQGGSSVVVPDPIDTTPKFDIVLSSNSNFFKKGQTFELICSIENITATYGIVAVDFVVNYNPGAFTPVYPEGADLTANYVKVAPKDSTGLLWEDIGTYCDTKNGVVYMRFAHKVAENGDGVKNNGELSFKILFTSNLQSGTYSFEATNCRGTDPGSSNNKKLAEVYANGSTFSATAAPASMELVSNDSAVTIEGGYIFGLKLGMTAKEVAQKFEGDVLVTSNGMSGTVATGYTVTASSGAGESAVVVIAGDINGSGELDATDYIVIKSCFLQQSNLDPMYLLAADVDRSGVVDVTDYLKVKSHFLGINKIY